MKYIFAGNTRYLISCICVLILQACSQDEDLIRPEISPAARTYPNVDEELFSHFRKFEDEARKRGQTYDLKALGIIGQIEEIDKEHVAGQCATYKNYHPRRITLDQTFWEQSSDAMKEYIVFHELGHCVLNRPHTEDSFSNGVCNSIMRSGNGGCYDYYNRFTRQYYVDELFEVEAISPF